jgi:putative FmdB family regulatory protein
MPIYEYNCAGCGQDFEALIRGDEAVECPGCGGLRLTKQFSVPAAHVAGGGSLPICESPRPGPCGAPRCGPMGCGM